MTAPQPSAPVARLVALVCFHGSSYCCQEEGFSSAYRLFLQVWTCICFVRLLTVHPCHCCAARCPGFQHREPVPSWRVPSPPLAPQAFQAHPVCSPGASVPSVGKRHLHTRGLSAGEGGRLPVCPGCSISWEQVQAGRSPWHEVRSLLRGAAASGPVPGQTQQVHVCVLSHTCMHLDVYVYATLVPPFAA